MSRLALLLGFLVSAQVCLAVDLSGLTAAQLTEQLACMRDFVKLGKLGSPQNLRNVRIDKDEITALQKELRGLEAQGQKDSAYGKQVQKNLAAHIALANEIRTHGVFIPLFNEEIEKIKANNLFDILEVKPNGKSLNETVFKGKAPPFDDNSPAALIRAKQDVTLLRFHVVKEEGFKSSWFKPVEENDFYSYYDEAQQNNALPKDSTTHYISLVKFEKGTVFYMGPTRPQIYGEANASTASSIFVDYGASKNLQYFRPSEVQLPEGLLKQPRLTEKNIVRTIKLPEFDYKFPKYLYAIASAKNVDDLHVFKDAFFKRVQEYWAWSDPAKVEEFSVWDLKKCLDIREQLLDMQHFFREREDEFTKPSLLKRLFRKRI